MTKSYLLFIAVLISTYSVSSRGQSLDECQAGPGVSKMHTTCAAGSGVHQELDWQKSTHQAKNGSIIVVAEANQEYDTYLHPHYDFGPDSPYTYYNLAQSHCEEGRETKAISNLHIALDLYPEFAYAYHFLGLLHYKRLDLDPALESLNHALRLDPSNSHAEVYRDRAALCLRGKYHCNTMEGKTCSWALQRTGRYSNLGKREYNPMLDGLPSYRRQ